MVEIISNTKKFEHNQYREVERKYLPLEPDALSEFRRFARPIEQYYLSHPGEPFSLRFREILGPDGELHYSAALKDRGTLTNDGLDRLEVEEEIPSDLYRFYKTIDAAVLQKLRYHVHPDIVIDYYENGHVQLESENDFAMQAFTGSRDESFVDVTGDRLVDNEWRAHASYRDTHDGMETLAVPPDVAVDDIAEALSRAATSLSTVVAQVCGRSGSGKSTIVRELQGALRLKGLDSVVISTDDYHRGASWLRNFNDGNEWTEWDHPVVYDTDAMMSDINRLLRGKTIDRRSIDFTVCEPVIAEVLKPAPVLIIEGIYAGAAQFEQASHLRVDVPTPLATCIGRRLLRDMKERPEFADPGKSFRYMLEQAEPMWRRQAGAHE